jgi:aminoglycoside phosphotransferase family enzyme/predicted kinase
MEDGRDQNNVLDFMASPEAYDPAPQRVERIETHASIVFLAGDRAYKVKRAVKYPFLDFSTLELRRRAAFNELAINRRTAPQLYLEVVPVTIDTKAEFRLRGDGEIVEWVLVMRRFDQANLYDRMAEEGRLSLAAMPALALTIALFHERADRMLSPEPSLSGLASVLKDNASAFAGKEARFPAGALEAVHRGSKDSLAALSPLLKERALGGYVRHCHGDLHLRNIVEIDGAPVLFDAIEFDDKIATVDILYDLAFLLMDLGARGLGDHANAVFNAYLDARGETGNLLGLAALPLFLSMRAKVRAKVELLRGELAQAAVRAEAFGKAASYVELARDYLAPSRPHLIAIGGLSGSGKSSVARALAPKLGAFPGAVHVRSDQERKRLFGVCGETRLPDSAYRQEVSGTVYRMCRKRALMALAAGRTVILDAVHAKPEEREATAKLAAQMGASFTGIWLEAPPATMRQRIERRENDISDATPSVLEEQLTYDLGAQSFAVVDAGRPLAEVVAACLKILGETKPG